MAKMENLKFEREGSDLLIRIHMDHDDCIASSGGSILVASSHNWKPIFVNGEELGLEVSMNIKRDFWPDEPRTVEDGWIRRQDRKPEK